jgi:hypothetical protein
MPVSTNPNATEPFWLACDAEEPWDRRPMFLVKFMTQREIDQHAELMRQARQTPDHRRCAKLILEALKVGIRGWRNFKTNDGSPRPFTIRAAFDLLTDRERWELAYNYPSAVQLTVMDAGFFDSPATSAGEEDAGTTPPAAAT